MKLSPMATAWIREHVLAPSGIPPAHFECLCQGASDACTHGEHGDCGLEQWIAWGGIEPETTIGRGHGLFLCKGAFGLYGDEATVWLADRACRPMCDCHCHRAVPQPTLAPAHGEQLGLFVS